VAGIVERQLALNQYLAAFGRCTYSVRKTDFELPGIFVCPSWQCIRTLPRYHPGPAFEDIGGWKDHLHFVQDLQESAESTRIANPKQTYFVVFQLRLWPFAIGTAGAHQTRATLTFQLDNNRADVDTF
jgi:hypothetical protein